MDRYQESFATDSAPFVEARNEYPITQESVKFNTAASGSCCFTTAGTSTFTVPAGVYNFSVEVTGGGAGSIACFCGNGTGGTSFTAGVWFLSGGPGETVTNRVSSEPGCQFTVVVGQGGPSLGCFTCTAPGGFDTLLFSTCCGGNSCFYNTDMAMIASGGLGVEVCSSTASLCVCVCKMVTRLERIISGVGWSSSSGGLVLRQSNIGDPCFHLRSCIVQQGGWCGNKSVVGLRAYLSNLYGTPLLVQLPTFGSGGINQNCCCALSIGADGLVAIKWLKGM
jgi:hypothetical protein